MANLSSSRNAKKSSKTLQGKERKENKQSKRQQDQKLVRPLPMVRPGLTTNVVSMQKIVIKSQEKIKEQIAATSKMQVMPDVTSPVMPDVTSRVMPDVISPVIMPKIASRRSLNELRRIDQESKQKLRKRNSESRKFLSGPRFTEGYEQTGLDDSKRPATVALPHIPTRSMHLEERRPRGETRGLSASAVQNKARKEEQRTEEKSGTEKANGRSGSEYSTSKSSGKFKYHAGLLQRIGGGDTEILDFCCFPLDSVDREHVEYTYKENELAPVSCTYLMWLQEHPQTVMKLRNHGLGANSIPVIKKSLEKNNVVQELDLAGNNLNDTGIEDLSLLLRGDTHIKELDISRNVFSTKGILSLGSLLEVNNTLSSICLSSNNLTDTDLELLCCGLEDNNNQLRKLELNYNSFTPQAGFILGRFLAIDKILQELQIEGNSIGPMGMWHLFQGLRMNKALRTLNVAANEVSEEGMEYIADIKDFGKSLEYLDLSDNFITYRCVGYLVLMLDDNRTLDVLKLDNNLIGTNGLILLMQNLIKQGNKTLTQLYAKGVFADKTVKDLCTEIRKRNSPFVLVGTSGTYGNECIDTMRTLQVYLKNNKIIDAERLNRLQDLDTTQI